MASLTNELGNFLVLTLSRNLEWNLSVISISTHSSMPKYQPTSKSKEASSSVILFPGITWEKSCAENCESSMPMVPNRKLHMLVNCTNMSTLRITCCHAFRGLHSATPRCQKSHRNHFSHCNMLNCLSHLIRTFMNCQAFVWAATLYLCHPV